MKKVCVSSFQIQSTSGIGNIRPSGRVRPVKGFRSARWLAHRLKPSPDLHSTHPRLNHKSLVFSLQGGAHDAPPNVYHNARRFTVSRTNGRLHCHVPWKSAYVSVRLTCYVHHVLLFITVIVFNQTAEAKIWLGVNFLQLQQQKATSSHYYDTHIRQNIPKVSWMTWNVQ